LPIISPQTLRLFEQNLTTKIYSHEEIPNAMLAAAVVCLPYFETICLIQIKIQI